MKVLTFVLGVVVLCCTKLPLYAENELVKIYYQGNELLAVQLVKGHLNLYVSHQFQEKKVTGPLYRKRKRVFLKRYFLKYQKQIAKITPYNYKKVLKKHLPNATELLKRIGRSGFRYVNTPSIIRYYNDFIVPEMFPAEDTPDRTDEVGLRD